MKKHKTFINICKNGNNHPCKVLQLVLESPATTFDLLKSHIIIDNISPNCRTIVFYVNNRIITKNYRKLIKEGITENNNNIFFTVLD
jgi:hypothetical protein